MPANLGGFEARYVVKRTDNKPCNPNSRYFVLDYSGADPAAIVALTAYAKTTTNPTLAKDLLTAIEHPELFPTQHE